MGRALHCNILENKFSKINSGDNDDDDNSNNGDVDASPRRGATTKSVVAHKEKPPQALGRIATHQEAARVLEKTNISKYLYQL